mgnify:CR=1 FL=1|jgi:DNA-binding response OmpR family regulator
MKKVLIIQDSISINAFFKFKLEEIGFYVDTVESALEGLDILKKENFDMVLLDIRLPAMNGIDLYKIIKADKRLSTVPIIFISAVEEKELIRLMKSIKSKYWFKLGSNIEELIDMIKKII